MIEPYIYEEGNLFVVKKEIDGELIKFSSFNSLEEAIEYRDEMDDYGWPYLPQESHNKEIEQNIFLENDRYAVSRKILDKEIVFGSFNDLKLAKEFKHRLLENAWNLNIFSKPSKYSKYIRKDHLKFTIFRRINGEYISFNSFNTLDEAILVRDELISKNWGMDDSSILENLGVKKLKGLNKNIGKIGRKYTVFKWEDSKCTFFGFYYDLRTAIKVRDKLFSEETDKIYDYVDQHQQNKDTKYISKVGNSFRIAKSINGKIKYFGHYSTLEEAITVRDKLIDNGWDESLARKGTTEKGNRGIHRTIRGYDVVKRIDGVLYNFGTFKTLEDAINERDFLEANNYFLDDIEDDEEIVEEKYDEYIFLKKDGKYYLENEIDGENRIFGIFDNPLDAVASRLDCIKNNWDLVSVTEDELQNSDKFIPFGHHLNDDAENVADEIIYTQLANDVLGFPVTVGKSYKNGGWAINRSYLDKLIPYITYEEECTCIIEGFEVECKINIHTRLFYNRNKILSDYLEKLSKIDNKIQTRIDLELNHGKYSLNKDSNKEFIKFSTLFSKSFKKGLFACPRKFSKEILPILDYELNSIFSVNNIDARGKLNLEFRIKFKDESLIEKLETFKKDGDRIEVILLL